MEQQQSPPIGRQVSQPPQHAGDMVPQQALVVPGTQAPHTPAPLHTVPPVVQAVPAAAAGVEGTPLVQAAV